MERTPRNIKLVLKAGYHLAACEYSLRKRGYGHTLDRSQMDVEPGASDEAAELAEARQLSWAVNAAARRVPFRTACLSRSLALLRLMRGAGIRGELVLGARKSGEEFGAHAWVEYRGELVNDSPDVGERYRAFK